MYFAQILVAELALPPVIRPAGREEDSPFPTEPEVGRIRWLTATQLTFSSLLPPIDQRTVQSQCPSFGNDL